MHTLEKELLDPIVMLTVKQFLLTLDRFFKLGRKLATFRLLAEQLNCHELVSKIDPK